MKILAFSDVHGDLKAIDGLVAKAKKNDVDLLICAGDLTNFGMELGKIVGKLKKCGKKLLIVHGNHETGNEIRAVESEEVIALHDRIYLLDGYVFYGYGDGGFSLVDERMERAVDRIAGRMNGRKAVVVTHAPPYGTKVDKLPWAGHCGCKSVTLAAKRLKATLLICGHLHENAGVKDYIGKTVVINAGKNGVILEI